MWKQSTSIFQYNNFNSEPGRESWTPAQILKIFSSNINDSPYGHYKYKIYFTKIAVNPHSLYYLLFILLTMQSNYIPWNIEAIKTRMLLSKRPPLRPNFSAIRPVMAPPIMPPTQKIDTAMDQIMVTLVWVTSVSVLLYSTIVIQSSINCNNYISNLELHNREWIH